MGRIGITDQKPTRQARLSLFAMLHGFHGLALFIMMIFSFKAKFDRVDTLPQFNDRLVICRRIFDQFLQPQTLELQTNCKHEIRIGHTSYVARPRLICVRVCATRHKIEYIDPIATNNRNPLANDVAGSYDVQRLGINRFYYRFRGSRGRNRGCGRLIRRRSCCRGSSCCRLRLRGRRRIWVFTASDSRCQDRCRNDRQKP